MNTDLFGDPIGAAKTTLSDLDEFNRRAAIALKGVNFGESPSRFAVDMIRIIHSGRPLTKDQQQGVYNTVHRYHRQITDRLATEYAALRAKESDQ